MAKQKHHNIALYILIVLLIIGQTGTIYLLTIRMLSLEQSISETKKSLSTEISEINLETQNKINELSSELSNTQSNLKRDLATLKADTSEDFSGIVEESVKGVVTIRTDISQGTGFLLTNDGYVVTNAHVLNNARFARTIDSNRREQYAELIGYDLLMDIALLKISGNFNNLELADSNQVKVGEKVIALGNPLGLSFSVTEGIISSVHRPGNNNVQGYIQTDAALNPGNSGGPLINKQGKVVGINNFKLGGAEAIGFALESNFIKSVANNIALNELNQTII